MNILKNKRLILLFKLFFLAFIIALLVFGIKGFIVNFDFTIFEKSLRNLSKLRLIFIIVLGIVAFIPMCLYDFLIKKKLNFKLSNLKLFKYSFIINAVTIVAGLGGATGISLRTYFYKNELKDKKLLLGEVSRISVLNPTGLSLLSIIYLLFYWRGEHLFSLESICPIIVALYIPGIIIYNLIRHRDENKKAEFKHVFLNILISSLDWLFSIGSLFIILKIVGANISFANYFPIYVLSMVLGTVSMLPGAVGAFDLTMLIGLTASGVSKEIALLGVFLFRVAYFITPVIISALLMAHEFWISSNKGAKSVITFIVRKFSFIVLRWLLLLSGIVLLVSNVFPTIIYRFKEIEAFRYSIEVSTSKAFLIVLGFLLIVISRLLKCKSKNIFYITLGILVACILLVLIKSFNFFGAIYLLFLIAILVFSRKEFTRTSFVLSVGEVIIDISLLTLFWVIYLFNVYLNMPFQAFTLPSVFRGMLYSSRNLMGYGSIGYILALALIAIMYFIGKYKNKIPNKTYVDYDDKIKAFLEKWDGTAVTHLMYLDDKYIYLSEEHEGLIQYVIYSNKLFVLGNPIGNPDTLKDFLEEFCDFAYKYGYLPIFYEVSGDMLETLHQFGYEYMKLGETAIVNVQDFTIAGQKMQKVRTCCNKINRENFTFEVIEGDAITDSILKDIKEISDHWLNGRKEQGFSLGFFDEEYIKRTPMGIVRDKDNIIKAFVTIMPTYGNSKKFCSDLMRFTRDTPRGLMDYMFVNLLNWGKEQGFEEFDFGVAPLSNVGTSKYSFLTEKISYQVYMYSKSYSFDGLKKFKAKYATSWEPRFLAYKYKPSLPLTVLQSNLIISGSDKRKGLSKSIEN